MTNILVTGGAGYLGSILVPRLLRLGWGRVTVIDNFMYGQSSLLDCIQDPYLTVVREAFEPDMIDLSKFDTIIHLACITGAPACDKDPWLARKTNLHTVERLIAKLSHNQQLIFPCTNSGYGIGQDSIECDETTPLRPVSLYGKLKVWAEEKVLAWGGISLRFATLFGASPRMRMDLLVNDFVYRALVDRYLLLFESGFKRNYLHVVDAAESIIHSLRWYKSMQRNAYNVGLSDANLSKLELAQQIKEFLPDTAIIESEVSKDIDKRNYIVSNAKIEASGWSPKFSLDEGIQELIRAFQILKPRNYTNV